MATFDIRSLTAFDRSQKLLEGMTVAAQKRDIGHVVGLGKRDGPRPWHLGDYVGMSSQSCKFFPALQVRRHNSLTVMDVLLMSFTPRCLGANRGGTGFIREGGIPDDKNAGNVMASSRMNSVPRVRGMAVGLMGAGLALSLAIWIAPRSLLCLPRDRVETWTSGQLLQMCLTLLSRCYLAGSG